MTTPEAGTDVLDTGEAGGKAIRGGALRTGAYGATLVLGLISVPLMTRHLGVVDYGYYVTVTAIVFVIGGFTEAGLTNLGIREFSALDGPARSRFMAAISGLRLALTAVGVGVATLFAWATGRPGVVVAGTAIAGLGLLLGLVQQTYAIPLTAQLRFGWLSVVDVLKQVVLVAVIVLCVVLGTGVVPFFWANVASGLTGLVVTAVLVRRTGISLRPAVDVARWQRMLTEIVPYALAAIAGLLYFRLGVLLLGFVGTDEEVGIYSTAFRITEVLSSLPYIAVGAAFPILARAARDDADRLRYGLQRLFDASVLVGCLLGLGTIAGAHFAIGVIAPLDEFGDSVGVLQIQAISILFTFLVAAFSFALLSLKRYRALLVCNVIALVPAAALTPLLAPSLGADGAAVATTVAEATLATAYYVAIARAEPRLRPRLGSALRVLPAAVLGAATLLLGLPSLLAALVAGLVFVLVAVVARAVPEEVTAAVLRRSPD